MSDTDTAMRTVPHIEITHDDAHPGESFELRAWVASDPPAALEGAIVIRDHDGQERGRCTITGFDGATNHTDGLRVTAPDSPGAYEWQALYAPDGAPPDETAMHPVALQVRAHAIRLTVWGARTVTADDPRARIRVGAKCSSGAALGGRDVTVQDAAGRVIAQARTADAPWPGTTGLHVAEVTVPLPETPGRHQLTAWLGPAPADERGAQADFTARVTPPPEYHVTVTVRAAEDDTPIPGARVVLHPHAATTDAGGVAHLAIPAGDYRLHAKAPGRLGAGVPLSVNEDAQTQLRLAPEPGEDFSAWA